LRVSDDGELVSDSVSSGLVDITGVNLQNSERTDESKALTPYTTTELDSKENYFPCTRCGKMLKNGPSLRGHLKKCDAPSRKKVGCPSCSLEFKREEDMEAHRVIHYGQISCPKHNVLFNDEVEVSQHFKSEDENQVGKSTLECCLCQKQFRHICIFMKHLRQHLGISAYRCKHCDKCVNSYASLTEHMARIHKTGADGMKAKEVRKANRSQTFRCPQCNRHFRNKGHLNEHVAGVHERNVVVPCPVCHKAFHTKKRMRKHLINSHRTEFTKDTGKPQAEITNLLATEVIQFEIIADNTS